MKGWLVVVTLEDRTQRAFEYGSRVEARRVAMQTRRALPEAHVKVKGPDGQFVDTGSLRRSS